MNSEIDPKVSEMSDVLIAKAIIADTFDLRPGNRSLVIGQAIAALKWVERSLGTAVLAGRHRVWTERRVRAIVDEEARRIEHYEIEDLRKVQLEEARHEFRRSTDRAARLAAVLAAQDPDFHGDEIDRLGQLVRGLDRPGNRGGAR